MKKRLAVVLIALSVAGALARGIATKVTAREDDVRGVVLGDVTTFTAYVVGIDKQDRTLTILGPQGNVVILEVSDEVRNFKQIEVGDHINIDYYEAVALYFGEHGSQPDEHAGLVVARAPKGAKPGVYAVGAVDISATVEAINKAKGTVTLELPHGHVETVKVDKDTEGFEDIRVGDSIHVRYTEAIAISVQ